MELVFKQKDNTLASFEQPHSERVRDMIITYSQMHRTDKCSQDNSIICPV